MPALFAAGHAWSVSSMTGPERSSPSSHLSSTRSGDMEVPRGGLSWLSHQATAERISAIATGVGAAQP